jgi:beta-glucanase (GH16 family)
MPSHFTYRSFFRLALSWIMLIYSVACSLVIPTPTATPIPTDTPMPTPTPTPEWIRAGWNLVWQDEFDGKTLDLTKWKYETGGHGWGNNELEYYTNNRPENARLENGQLIIEAREEDYLGRKYTSARLKTQGLGEWQYGRVEARLKIPRGQGIWPAFWMLGNNINRVGWPNSGEIDIMENIGREPSTIHGTVHGPGYSGANGVGGPQRLSEGAFADDFHVYAVEWETEEVRWYVDDTRYFNVTPALVPGKWVYDHPFFIIMNVAVGGGWPGNPDKTTVFPQQMIAEYVRVYEKAP